MEAIENINWDFEEALKNPTDLSGKGRVITPISGLKLSDIAKRKAEFEAIGVEAIRAGKVAAVLLAGGMGTRLGVDGPKGAYNIGITKPLYIFEQQVKNILAAVKEADVYPPIYIMTSEKNYEDTKAFWQEQEL